MHKTKKGNSKYAKTHKKAIAIFTFDEVESGDLIKPDWSNEYVEVLRKSTIKELNCVVVLHPDSEMGTVLESEISLLKKAK